MKLQIANDFNNYGTPAPIYYKTHQMTGNMPTERVNSLKVDTKTQLGEKESETLAIYMTLFRNGSPETLLKFVTILNNIIKGHELYTGTHKYKMTRNLVVGESLQVFDHNNWYQGTDTNYN